jgi:hypothetical protein
LDLNVKKQAMKRFNFLPAVIAVVLMVVAASCTTMGGTQDEYYERQTAGNRIYVDDPYRGTVILERDPYSGRYYEVGSYGSAYPGTLYRNYPDNRYYGRTNNNRNYNRGGYNRGNRGTQATPPAQPTQDQIRQREKTREEARKQILGN